MEASTFKKEFESSILELVAKEQSDYLFSGDEVLHLVIIALDKALPNFETVEDDGGVEKAKTKALTVLKRPGAVQEYSTLRSSASCIMPHIVYPFKR